MFGEKREGGKQPGSPGFSVGEQGATPAKKKQERKPPSQLETIIQEAITAAAEVLQLEENKKYLNVAQEYQPFDLFESRNYDTLIKDGLMSQREQELLVVIDQQISQLKEKIGAAGVGVASEASYALTKKALKKLESAKSEFEATLAKRIGFDKQGLRAYQDEMRSELSNYLKQAEIEIAQKLADIEQPPMTQQGIKPGEKEVVKGSEEALNRADNYLQRQVKPAIESIMRTQQPAMEALERIIGKKAVAELKTLTKKVDEFEGLESLTEGQVTEMGKLKKERKKKIEQFTQSLDIKFNGGLGVIGLRPDLIQKNGEIKEHEPYIKKIEFLVSDQVGEALQLLSKGSKDNQALTKEAEVARYQIVVNHRILEELTVLEVKRLSDELATRRARKTKKGK